MFLCFKTKKSITRSFFSLQHSQNTLSILCQRLLSCTIFCVLS